MTRAKAVTLITIVALFSAGLASWTAYRYVQRIPAKWQSTTAVVPDLKPVRQEVIVQSWLMSGNVPKGRRAVTVAVNEVSGVGGFISPGSRVDVAFTAPASHPGGTTATSIMLQNVPVLASGQVTGQKEWKPAIVPTVTMALTPADAEMLVQAGHSGDLRLLLRSDADTETPTAVNTVSKKRLPWGDHRAHSTPSVAAAQQKPRHSVTIIDGGVRTVKEFLLP